MTDFRTATTDQIEDTSRDRGELGEILIDTTKETIVLENGSQDGVPLAREDMSNVNLAQKRFSWVTEIEPLWAQVNDGRLNSTEFPLLASGELIIRVPGIYFDITVPYEKLRATTNRALPGDAPSNANSIKVMDFYNHEVFASLTADHKLLINAMNKSNVPARDITTDLELYYREIKVLDLPIVTPFNPSNGQIAYYHESSNSWRAATIKFALEKQTLTFGRDPSNNPFTGFNILRGTNFNIGPVGNGELAIGFRGAIGASVFYDDLRLLTSASNGDTATDRAGNTPANYIGILAGGYPIHVGITGNFEVLVGAGDVDNDYTDDNISFYVRKTIFSS